MFSQNITLLDTFYIVYILLQATNFQIPYIEIPVHSVYRSIKLQLKCSWIFKPFGKCTTVGTRNGFTNSRRDNFTFYSYLVWLLEIAI